MRHAGKWNKILWQTMHTANKGMKRIAPKAGFPLMPGVAPFK